MEEESTHMKEKLKIILTDTHFGVKNNSIKFFGSQKKLFNQLFQYIDTVEDSEFDVVHLGDLFESRSSLSVQIMYEVKNLLWILNGKVKQRNKNNRLIFVAGNHDFFSPDSDEVNSLDTFIKEVLPDAIIIDKYCWRDEDDLYIPWYQMNDPEKFNLINKIDAFNGVKRIFTHCECWEFKTGRIPKDINIYSGHIHQYREYNNETSNNSILYNLSTPYALDFGDSNDDKKGFWTLRDKNLELHQNDQSIKFRTYINDQIFNIDDLEKSIERGDNYRIYLTEENRTKYEYIERLNELSTKLRYVTIILTSEDVINISENVASGGLNIDEMLGEMIPDHLKGEFKVIKNEINNEN